MPPTTINQAAIRRWSTQQYSLTWKASLKPDCVWAWHRHSSASTEGKRGHRHEKTWQESTVTHTKWKENRWEQYRSPIRLERHFSTVALHWSSTEHTGLSCAQQVWDEHRWTQITLSANAHWIKEMPPKAQTFTSAGTHTKCFIHPPQTANILAA